ncbi:hypothetical protein B0H17DRAFT_1206603 [Mycena rosella]|uniref:Uncharacterized protein n=1 Tax=Mycena rosella TaxID=1033263 RepID=A0AAD7D4J9_MYCRO|nr:hypothetical protein B0H17DRAFT_1206603 [Mycena rosella]
MDMDVLRDGDGGRDHSDSDSEPGQSRRARRDVCATAPRGWARSWEAGSWKLGAGRLEGWKLGAGRGNWTRDAWRNFDDAWRNCARPPSSPPSSASASASRPALFPAVHGLFVSRGRVRVVRRAARRGRLRFRARGGYDDGDGDGASVASRLGACVVGSLRAPARACSAASSSSLRLCLYLYLCPRPSTPAPPTPLARLRIRLRFGSFHLRAPISEINQ